MRLSIIIFTIVFGILSFAPNMQGGQFFKFSEIIEHFDQHQKSDQVVSSFMDFIKDHYFSNKYSEDKEHHLPFKTSVTSVFVFVIHDVKLLPVHEYLILSDKIDNCFSEPNSHGYYQTKSIWNPPQMC